MSSHAHEEEYSGPATVHADGVQATVRVALSGRLEPLDGRYHWGGRIAPHEHLTPLVRQRSRTAALSIQDGPPVPVRLGDVDPWGGVRVTATGAPPWPDGVATSR